MKLKASLMLLVVQLKGEIQYEYNWLMKLKRKKTRTEQSTETLEERLLESSGSSSGVLSSGEILQLATGVLEDCQSVLPLLWSRVLANWSRVE